MAEGASFHIKGIDTVSKGLEEAIEATNRLMFGVYSYIGEKAVTIARDQGNYTDRTGNLRSSIGYEIFHDGEPQVGFQFAQVKEGAEGTHKGAELLEKLRGKYPKGWVLVVCAGMEYASYVQDVKGYDVTLRARVEAQRLAKKLLSKINGRKK